MRWTDDQTIRDRATKPNDSAKSGNFERSCQPGKSYVEGAAHIKGKTANSLIVRNSSRLQPVSFRIAAFCVSRHGNHPVQRCGLRYLCPEHASEQKRLTPILGFLHGVQALRRQTGKF